MNEFAQDLTEVKSPCLTVGLGVLSQTQQFKSFVSNDSKFYQLHFCGLLNAHFDLKMTSCQIPWYVRLMSLL